MEHDGTVRSPWISPSPCGPCGPPHTLAKDRPKARPMMLAWRPRPAVPVKAEGNGNSWRAPPANHGKNMGKTWGKHGKNMGTWENHRKILGKLWENHGKILGTSQTSAYKMEVLMGKPSRNDSFSIAMFDYRRTIHRIAFWLYQPPYELYTVYIFTGSLKPSISYCSTYVYYPISFIPMFVPISRGPCF